MIQDLCPKDINYYIFFSNFIRELQKEDKLPCLGESKVFNGKQNKTKQPSGTYNLLTEQTLDLFLINPTF